MTRKVADSLVRTIPDTIVRGDLKAGDSLPAIDEMAPGRMAAIPGTDGDFRSLDGIVEGMSRETCGAATGPPRSGR